MDDARAKWNGRYRARDPEPYPPTPSPWLADHDDLLRRAAARHAQPRALDCACGTGRNAIHLARLGFAVVALDISDVAIAWLTETAAAHELTIDARVQDLTSAAIPATTYHVIVVIDYLQRDLYRTIAQALTPGGIVIAETVTRAHVEHLGRDFDLRFVLEPGELGRAFPGLELIDAREGIVDRGGRQRAVASIAAEMPFTEQ